MFEKIRELRDECPICEKERALAYGRRTEIVKVHGEEILVKVKVYHCIEGDHYFYDLKDEEDKYQTAYREYRKRKGLLRPEEIKHIRETYGLSQRAFARFLSWGAITVQRYETGALQDSGHNTLLNFLKDTENFRRYFESRKSSLPERITTRVEKRLCELNDKEKQLEMAFFFRHSRLEASDVNLTRALMRKSANREYLKTLMDIFARHQTKRQFRTSIETMEKAKLSLWHARRTHGKTNRNFAINKEGELALAA